MAATDSAPVFLARCKSVGLEDALVDRMVASGFNTYANFAFSSSYQPGSTDEGPFVEAVLKKILGDTGAAHAQAPVLRRLFYESYTLVASELKRKMERVDDDKPKIMPLQERASRWNELKKRVTGFSFHEEREPSFQLIDLLAQQTDDGQIRYIIRMAPLRKAISGSGGAQEDQ